MNKHILLRPPWATGVSCRVAHQPDPASGGRTCSLHPLSAHSYSSSVRSSPRPPSRPFSPSPRDILSFRHRYVTELIQSAAPSIADTATAGYHRFFSNAAWSIDDLYESLARDAIRTFFPEGIIELGVDDTLCRRRGLTIFGTGMHHDPLNSSRKLPSRQLGTHDWVILSLLISKPPWSPTKVWPYRWGCDCTQPSGTDQGQGETEPGQGHRQGQGQESQERLRPQPSHPPRAGCGVDPIVCAQFPGRKIVMRQGRWRQECTQHLAENVDLISRVASNAALYEPAPPPRPKQKGAPRKKGSRLPSMPNWVADGTKPWRCWNSTSTVCTRSCKSRR